MFYSNLSYNYCELTYTVDVVDRKYSVAIHIIYIYIHIYIYIYIYIRSFRPFSHSAHFYSSTPSSPLLLRGTPDYSTDTVSAFHSEAHRQLQVKDLPKVPTV